jgi:hypothetical protein
MEAGMQQQSLGWAYEYRPPLEEKLFFLYLLWMVVLSAANSVSLVHQLWWFSRDRRTLPGALGGKDRGADVLAIAALTNRLSSNPTLIGTSQPVDKNDDSRSRSQILQEADRRFSYVWEMCAAEIRSAKRHVLLTLLLSVLVLAYGATNISRQIAIDKRVGIGSFSSSVAELLMQVALGISVCAAIYAVFNAFENALVRRKAAWNYFCAKGKSQSSPE